LNGECGSKKYKKGTKTRYVKPIQLIQSPNKMKVYLITLQSSSIMAQTFKVLLLGAGGCGKTSLVKANKKFDPKYHPTENVSIIPCYYNNTLEVWDTAGQKKLPIRHINNARAIIVMFDVSSKLSYEQALEYIDIIGKKNPNPVLLVGNKADIVNNRKIFQQDVQYQPYVEISVKNKTCDIVWQIIGHNLRI
jgi:small GTP-binding protein